MSSAAKSMFSFAFSSIGATSPPLRKSPVISQPIIGVLNWKQILVKRVRTAFFAHLTGRVMRASNLLFRSHLERAIKDTGRQRD
jgi:hypothetical protein